MLARQQKYVLVMPVKGAHWAVVGDSPNGSIACMDGSAGRLAGDPDVILLELCIR